MLLEQYARHAPAPAAGRPHLLELGAGGGHLLAHLQQSFTCTATDVSGPMLELCQRLVPRARVKLGDMRDLRLAEQFDVVLLCDAVDYMRTPADVRAALRTAVAHLAPGGLLFVAPTYTRDDFCDRETAEESAESETEEVNYFSYVHRRGGELSGYEMILLYLLREKATGQVRVIEDRHECGLFSLEQWCDFLAEVDLRTEHVEDDKAWTLLRAWRGAAADRGSPHAARAR